MYHYLYYTSLKRAYIAHSMHMHYSNLNICQCGWSPTHMSTERPATRRKSDSLASACSISLQSPSCRKSSAHIAVPVTLSQSGTTVARYSVSDSEYEAPSGLGLWTRRAAVDFKITTAKPKHERWTWTQITHHDFCSVAMWSANWGELKHEHSLL
jgi:hypothetical protein